MASINGEADEDQDGSDGDKMSHMRLKNDRFTHARWRRSEERRSQVRKG